MAGSAAAAPSAPARFNRSLREMNVITSPFVSSHELALANHMPLNRSEQIRSRQTGLEIKRRVDRIHDEMIVVRFARRRRRTAVDRSPESGDALNRAGDRARHRRIRLERNVL